MHNDFSVHQLGQSGEPNLNINFHSDPDQTGEMNAMDLSGFSGTATNDIKPGKNTIVRGNVDIVYQDSTHYNNSIEPSIETSTGLYTNSNTNGLRINKVASQYTKKQSIQRIYDNKNIYK